ncbi:MAG: DUF1801 domain-containing protein [Saprospiraceae bacterium]|nr:DUF1801 domain-containing protein [Saprospiraceae bacterium]MBP8212971.1 DUF1801 domain-containing protein [Saprospiraceae bacterium]
MEVKKYITIDEYFEDISPEIVEILMKIKSAIAGSAPEAIECIAYNMPAFKLHNKPLVYFAAFRKHIGFYALPTCNIAFQPELSKYKTGKGSIQFPLDEDIPFELIKKITTFRVGEVNQKVKKS